jgi:hypothetical protein
MLYVSNFRKAKINILYHLKHKYPKLIQVYGDRIYFQLYLPVAKEPQKDAAAIRLRKRNSNKNIMHA